MKIIKNYWELFRGHCAVTRIFHAKFGLMYILYKYETRVVSGHRNLWSCTLLIIFNIGRGYGGERNGEMLNFNDAMGERLFRTSEVHVVYYNVL